MPEHTDLPTAALTSRRNYTLDQLPPQMSGSRMIDYGAVGRTADDEITLTLSESAARQLATIVLRYEAAAHAGDIHVDDDHDAAFWDGIALDTIVVVETLAPPPASSATTMVHSIGKTADR